MKVPDRLRPGGEGPRQPITPEEWQFAVDSANALLVLRRLLDHGLIKGGPSINVDRCTDMVRRGRERGIVPGRQAIVEMAAGFAAKGQEQQIVDLALEFGVEIEAELALPPEWNPRETA